jgi:putative transposase
MSLEDVRKTALITKSNLFDWNVMPFGMKNATNTFSRTMTEVFGQYMDKFLKVFVDDLNIHNMIWEDHL